MKEIQSVSSPLKPKVANRREKKRNSDVPAKIKKNAITKARESNSKDKIRKIRIRLTDPSKPNSYVCELFDCSLEKDKDETSCDSIDVTNYIIESSYNDCGFRKASKPRNYFDVLMSDESRRNLTINTALQNEQIAEETKILRTVETDDVIQNRKLSKKKNKQKLLELLNKRKGIQNYDHFPTSDEEESIFSNQSRLKFTSVDPKDKKPDLNGSGNVINKENNVTKSKVHSRVIKKNTTNILNYFSKATICKNKASAKVRARHLKEVEILESEKKKSWKVGDIVSKHADIGAKGKQVGKTVNAKRKSSDLHMENIRLAPVFQKKVKNVVDPNIRKARQEFLQNGLPTNMRKSCGGHQNPDLSWPPIYFPLISHVQQKDDDCEWTSRTVIISCLRNDIQEPYFHTEKLFRFDISNKDNFPRSSDRGGSQVTKNTLTRLQSKYKNVNVQSIFNSLKKKKESFVKRMEAANLNLAKALEKEMSSNGIVDDTEDAEVFNSLWTEIYKPKSSEILGNKNVVTKLSAWLRSWKEYDSEIKVLGKSEAYSNSNKMAADNSDDDFITCSEDSLDLRTPGNVCFLSGPISSGKTALVYALASELDFNVLEVNSSSKRTGKQLLTLQEATKSHRVRSGLGHLPEVVKKGKKTKKKKVGVSKMNDSKISLILIEDADIFFEEHDEGYVSALSTLVQSSKRPFIFLSNDPNCGYFKRLTAQPTLQLEMHRPNFYNLCAVLEIIALLEGVSLENEKLQLMVQNNQFDLRKSLLELQFWIQSGKNLFQEAQKPFELGRLWWGFNRFLYNKDNVHHLKLNYRKRKRVNELYDSSSDEGEEVTKRLKLASSFSDEAAPMKSDRKVESSIHDYSKILDSLSVVDLFGLGEDVEPIPFAVCKPKDGLCLSECMEPAKWNANALSVEIVKELLCVSANVFKNRRGDERHSKCVSRGPSWEENRWRIVQQNARLDLTSLVPLRGDNIRRSLHVDYLPIIRNICRSERTKFMGNTKRKNRFHHYFKTLGANPREESLDVSCDVFEV